MIRFKIGIAETWKRVPEKGQGLVEYALILFLVAVVVIAILVVLGPQVGSVFSAVTKGVSSPQCANPNPAGMCPPGQNP